jgi:hypothetical protein
MNTFSQPSTDQSDTSQANLTPSSCLQPPVATTPFLQKILGIPEIAENAEIPVLSSGHEESDAIQVDCLSKHSKRPKVRKPPKIHAKVGL